MVAVEGATTMATYAPGACSANLPGWAAWVIATWVIATWVIATWVIANWVIANWGRKPRAATVWSAFTYDCLHARRAAGVALKVV